MKKNKRIPGIHALDHHWINASPSVARDAQYLMVVLHGRGDSLDSFVSVKNELQIPGMNYLLVNAPRAYDGGYSWYAFEPHQQNGILKSRNKLLNLVDELEQLGWSRSRIFFYGFSQGALVSCDLAMNCPHSFAGIIAISGYIYFFDDWKKTLKASAFRTPWLVTHGLNDDVLPIAETREHVQKLKSVGLPILWREFLKDHEIELFVEVPFIKKWVLSKISDQNRSHATAVYRIDDQTSSSNSKQRSNNF